MKSEPIITARAVPGKQLLIFGDFTRLTAYSPTGLLWASEDLSWDGLEITSVTNEAIAACGWDAAREAMVPFVVNVATGISNGGARPGEPPKSTS